MSQIFDENAQAKTTDSAPVLETASDLSAEAFVRIRDLFFECEGKPKRVELRDKKQTQDDPFDERIAEHLGQTLDAASGMAAAKATGPLITPDMALYRPGLCNGVPVDIIKTDLRRAVGIEVKKLQLDKNGNMARASGMDFNSTPPCGTARIYTKNNKIIEVRSFYLFVFEIPGDGYSEITMMTLCDGNLLNENYELYLTTTGRRTKLINIGSYGDGANRIRPMMIFANPFTSEALYNRITLVHPSNDLDNSFPNLVQVGSLSRTRADGTGLARFYVYRHADDVQQGDNGFDINDPFRTPKRKEETAQRGKFKIDINPSY